MRAFGAELLESGHDFDAARDTASSLAKEHGLVMVPSFHRDLVRGVATYALELFRGAPPLATGAACSEPARAKRASSASTIRSIRTPRDPFTRRTSPCSTKFSMNAPASDDDGKKRAEKQDCGLDRFEQQRRLRVGEYSRIPFDARIRRRETDFFGVA